jgi:transcription elongation factor GreA-like protein
VAAVQKHVRTLQAVAAEFPEVATKIKDDLDVAVKAIITDLGNTNLV